MKAILLRNFGDANALEYTDVPTPAPGPGETLIRVAAASVNPVDYKIRNGGYKKANIKLPLILGRDVSGVVAAVGTGVTHVKVGDEVYAFLGSKSGGYAEFAVAAPNEVAKKPTTVGHIHAAAVPLAATTAWQALFDQGEFQPGQRVLIHGASGGVGHFAVQFAKVHNAIVIATASNANTAFVKSLGADEVIEYQREHFEQRVSNVDLVIDLVGGDTQAKSWRVLRKGGTLVSTLGAPPADDAAAHQVKAKGFMAEPKAEELTEFARLIDAGKVHIRIFQTFPLAETRRAHEALESEHPIGKIVLTVP